MTAVNKLQKGRIVVVDDEPDIREYIKILLQERNYQVFAASSAKEAMAHLEEHDSDVLVTDIYMPEMSGLELIQKSRRIRKFLQFIIITGHGDMDSAVMSLRMGAAGYLQKPLDFAELEASVSLALEKARLHRELESYQQQLEQMVETRTQLLQAANDQLLREIKTRKEAEKKTLYQASHDYLTGLPNRLLLEDRLLTTTASARRNKSKFAIMLLDLDDFKEVNDTYGHEMGDKVLQTLATRLTDLLRENDTIVRIGADEFLLLLPDVTTKKHTTTVAEKIRAVLAVPMQLDQQVVNISTSIGIALYPDDDDDPDILIKKAYREIYQIKRATTSLDS